ncbi:MAG: hypothetical protein MK081_15635 [Flavobacteriales bacterium]|nr:hypothetical protein [Flavobacteriales bacterium]
MKILIGNQLIDVRKVIGFCVLCVLMTACNEPQFEYYESGKIYSKFYLKNEELNGEYLRYYENGSVELKTNYQAGIETGQRKEYDESGNVRAITSIIDGKFHGKTVIFFDESDIPQQVQYYTHGVLDSAFWFSTSGKIASSSKMVTESRYYQEIFDKGGVLEFIALVENENTLFYRSFVDGGNLIDDEYFRIVTEGDKRSQNIGQTLTFEIEVAGDFRNNRPFFVVLEISNGDCAECKVELGNNFSIDQPEVYLLNPRTDSKIAIDDSNFQIVLANSFSYSTKAEVSGLDSRLLLFGLIDDDNNVSYTNTKTLDFFVNEAVN